MPDSKKAKYEHHRKRKPSEFIKSSFRNVLISHAPHRKKYKAGTRAIVGILKHPGTGRKYATQSILIPKRKI